MATSDFQKFPHPSEFLRDGGLIGVEYLYVCTDNAPKAQDAGFGQLTGVPYFTVKGTPMTIMGRGTPSQTGRPGGGRCVYWIDKDAIIRTGLSVPGFAAPTPEPPTDTPPASPATTSISPIVAQAANISSDIVAEAKAAKGAPSGEATKYASSGATKHASPEAAKASR